MTEGYSGYVLKARHFVHACQWDHAQSCLQAALQLDPKGPEALLLLGALDLPRLGAYGVSNALAESKPLAPVEHARRYLQELMAAPPPPDTALLRARLLFRLLFRSLQLGLVVCVLAVVGVV